MVDGRRAVTFPGPTLTAPTAPGGIGVVAALLTALLGGLVLNLMPCVLPVLSLKLVGLARHAGEGRRAVRVGLVASGLGVVASFLALAGATVAAKSLGVAVGWGVQFQQPVFLGGMAALTVLFAASLFDWVHFGVPSFASGLDVRGTRRAWVRSFLTGAFATLLATPCSAPFVGTAVGFALARGPAEIIGVFLCLGLGMASPFFAAALAPRAVAWLPRPGPWMITLRRSLGCLLLGTAAWLVAVLDGVAGPAAAGAVVLPLSALLALPWWASRRRTAVRGEPRPARRPPSSSCWPPWSPAPRRGSRTGRIGTSATSPSTRPPSTASSPTAGPCWSTCRRGGASPARSTSSPP